MKNAIFGMLLFALSANAIGAQEQNLLQQLDQFSRAIMANDFDRMIELTPSKIIKNAGGAFYKKEEFRNDKEIRDSQNIEYLDYSISDKTPDILKGATWQAISEITFTASFSEARFNYFVPVLAISEDEGINWKFVNLEKHDEESIKIFMPEYNDKLSFPKRKAAVPVNRK